ncbi:MAG: hypothetical protein H7Z16_18490 [Pyrinomonadaceae bacterium]|nr:hypothetical protein [Pyrinomonadaceae bacterium]
MAYSFPVFRKGIIFRTDRLVSSEEAKRIAELIVKDPWRYQSAFETALARNNGSIDWETDRIDKDNQERDSDDLQLVGENYVLHFPLIGFRYNGFTVEARNSLTVCRHEKKSKIWTRLSCARFGEARTRLTAAEVSKFFEFASANVDHILDGLAVAYFQHAKDAGVAVPKADGYGFQLRAFNSTTNNSRLLFNRLQRGLGVSEALDDDRFRPELIDYFQITLGEKLSVAKIKDRIKNGNLDVFGYKSTEHEAIFTARISATETDICGFGYDDDHQLNNSLFSHAATKDLLKEYAQNF